MAAQIKSVESKIGRDYIIPIDVNGRKDKRFGT